MGADIALGGGGAAFGALSGGDAHVVAAGGAGGGTAAGEAKALHERAHPESGQDGTQEHEKPVGDDHARAVGGKAAEGDAENGLEVWVRIARLPASSGDIPIPF